MRTDITEIEVYEVINKNILITEQSKAKHSKRFEVDFTKYFYIYVDNVLLVKTIDINFAINRYNEIKL